LDRLDIHKVILLEDNEPDEDVSINSDIDDVQEETISIPPDFTDPLVEHESVNDKLDEEEHIPKLQYIRLNNASMEKAW
jgi:hypothetical protein